MSCLPLCLWKLERRHGLYHSDHPASLPEFKLLDGSVVLIGGKKNIVDSGLKPHVILPYIWLQLLLSNLGIMSRVLLYCTVIK